MKKCKEYEEKMREKGEDVQDSHKTGINIRIGLQTWTRSQLMQPFGRQQSILPAAMAMIILRKGITRPH
ncbi:hypothetical protein M758_UG253000 [Ceratodon purpureus]|nr:hypothetical protein M758_UG253000 [Ceratodon purpureus]